MLKKIHDFIFAKKEEPTLGITSAWIATPGTLENYSASSPSLPPCEDPRAHDFFCSICKVGFTKKLGAVNHKRIKHPNGQ